jgi:hypothetical protein
MMTCSKCGGVYLNDYVCEECAALPPVRSEPLFGTRGWTSDDLKSIALAKCIDLYRGMDSEGLYHAGPLVQALADVGRDACTPHVPNAPLTGGQPSKGGLSC